MWGKEKGESSTSTVLFMRFPLERYRRGEERRGRGRGVCEEEVSIPIFSFLFTTESDISHPPPLLTTHPLRKTSLILTLTYAYNYTCIFRYFP